MHQETAIKIHFHRTFNLLLLQKKSHWTSVKSFHPFATAPWTLKTEENNFAIWNKEMENAETDDQYPPTDLQKTHQPGDKHIDGLIF